ncbi:MAG: hypothetical protein ACT4QG_07585 [Sporichthyaceae bacterium]
MRSSTSTRVRSAAVGGAVSALALGVMAVPAQAAPEQPGFSFVDSSYILTLRSGGIEAYSKIPRDLPTDYGHSYVDLVHDIGQETGRCEAVGAGYWLGGEVEEGVLGPGAAPPDAGDVSGGYRNPTVARDVKPNLSPGENESAKDPGVRNYFPPGQEVADIPAEGNGVRWAAGCKDDAEGKAEGDNSNVGPFQGVGSISQARVDKTTGVYTGTSRAYMVGLQGAQGFDSASTFMQITNKPNEKPTITYRMSYFNAGKNPDQNGITFGGQDIPVEEFTDKFNEQAKAGGAAAKPVGPAGAGTLTPEVGVSTDGGRYSITISAGHGNVGVAAREGTIGENQGMRVASITFQGIYGNAA